MPMTGIYGKGGSGKNVIAMYYLVKYFNRVEKFLNFETKLPNATKIDSIDLFELPETNEIRLVVWDEAYTELDQREFMSLQNKINNYLLMQSRKNNMSIICISQLNILDVRYRRLEERIIKCKDRPIYDKHLEHFKGDFHYLYFTGRKIFPFTMKYKTAKKLFPLYDTKQKILPKDFEQMKQKLKTRNPKERNKVINEIVEKILAKYDIASKKDITHDWLKNTLLDLELDFTYEPYVYVRLRNRI